MDISSLYARFVECSMVTTDTRNCPANSMFLALKGETFNGNAFAAQALEKGCRYAVVDEKEYADPNDARIIWVENCLQTLQDLANYHRRQLGIRILGITGTNGKTTTKELVSTVLQQKYKTLFTQGNLNNHIGVPLTLLSIKKEHELAVVEMGANHPGEIKKLVHIVEPDYGLITNVGKAHLEGFGSFEGVIHTKGELYDYLRESHKLTVFLDNDNEHLQRIAEGLHAVRYGVESSEALAVHGVLGPCAPFLTFDWSAEGKAYHVHTHLIGSYNLKNALAAITVGRYFQVPDELIVAALEAYIPQNNRSQLTETADNKLVVDAYNANPTSMKAALENFVCMEVPHKWVVLGDMKELGASSEEEHRKVVDYLMHCHFERVMLVGGEFGRVNTTFEHYTSVEEVKQILQQEKPHGRYILIKGSNSMKLSQLKEIL